MILGVGPILKEALDAAEKLKEDNNIDVSVYSMGGIRPLDIDFLERIASQKYKAWLTLEEHGLSGGLGATINNWSIINNKNIKIVNLTTPNNFIHNLGNQSFVRESLHLNKNSIVKKIIELC